MKVTPEQYPDLLALQVACIRGLGDTYNQEHIDAWVNYLEQASPERFGAFENRVWVGPTGAIDGFVSWTSGATHKAGTIECLYVRGLRQGRGVGRLLLQEAEHAMGAGYLAVVRSTLNARPFYEQNGYTLQEEGTARAGFPIAILSKTIQG